MELLYGMEWNYVTLKKHKVALWVNHCVRPWSCFTSSLGTLAPLYFSIMKSISIDLREGEGTFGGRGASPLEGRV